MKVLVVIHRYPPDGTAGAEVFASSMVREFEAKGLDVTVLTSVKDVARKHLSVHRRRHGATPVVEIVNNLYETDFETNWRHPRIDALFGELLDEVRPDVVHVHHMLYLSTGILRVARDRGVPSLVVLHDFWLGCARFGQLLHPDGKRCEHVDPERCGTCLPSLPWRQSDLARRVGRGVAALKSLTGVDVSGPLSARHRRGIGGPPAAPSAEDAARYAALAARRRDEILEVIRDVRPRVMLPARFQVPWFLELGIPEELIAHVPTGLEWEVADEFPRVPREQGAPLRITMLATLVPHKGAHVLVDAWGKLSGDVRARATLAIHGPGDSRPAYVEELRRDAAAVGLEIGPSLDRAGVREILARTDLLVIPSLWFEVRPLVMMEAHAAGARILATDLGGMAEVVHDGAPGATFPLGDAAALAAELEREIRRDPSGDAPHGPTENFPRWPEAAEVLVRQSEELIAQGPAAMDPGAPRS